MKETDKMRSLGPHGGGGVTANAYELLKYVDMCRNTDFNYSKQC